MHGAARRYKKQTLATVSPFISSIIFTSIQAKASSQSFVHTCHSLSLTMKSFVAIAALAALVKAQDASTLTVASSVLAEMTEIPANPADALDFAGIEAVPEPSYTEVPGLTAQVISYASATAISSAAAAVTEDPLTVYPAATDVAMNAAGESDDGSSATTTAALEKRGLAKRTACAAQPAISNTYSVDVTR